MGLPKEASGVTPFADVPSGAWFAREVHTAYDAGLVQGLGPTTFGPERRITRQELAVLLARALEQADLAQWAREGVAQAVGEGLVKGRTPTTIAPLGTVTRAEAATMLKRLMDRTMKLPVTFTGLLHVSTQGGRHFELAYGGSLGVRRGTSVLCTLKLSINGQTRGGFPLRLPNGVVRPC